MLIVALISVFLCDDPDKGRHASGFSQKGPFIQGSSVTMFELDKDFAATGESYPAVTSDNFGSFDIKSDFKSEHLEIVSEGFYFDEVKGALSDANLTLRTISHIPDERSKGQRHRNHSE